MLYLLGLTVAFGLASIYMFVHCFFVVVRWNHDVIECWTGPFRRRAIAWQGLCRTELSSSGTIYHYATDGGRLRIDPYMDGIDELMQRVVQCLPTLHASRSS